MDGEFCRLSSDGIKFLSIAFISDKGDKLYMEIEQEKVDIDPWVTENVLPLLQEEKVTGEEAKIQIKKFVEKNYGDEKPVVVADVNQFDWMGICGLFGVWDIPFFYIPLDFSTVLYTKGIDIDADRNILLHKWGLANKTYRKHHALDDAEQLYVMWRHISEN